MILSQSGGDFLDISEYMCFLFERLAGLETKGKAWIVAEWFSRGTLPSVQVLWTVLNHFDVITGPSARS